MSDDDYDINIEVLLMEAEAFIHTYKQKENISHSDV